MKAGLELDCMIATKIMNNECDNCGEAICTCREVGIGSGLPRYSTDISAAWEVLERLVGEEGPSAEIQVIKSRPAPGRVWVYLFDRKYSGYASTLPLAICRAALAALKVKE